MKYGVLPDAAIGCPQGHGRLHVERSTDPFICDWCNEVGFGKRYSCAGCFSAEPDKGGFHVHRGCVEAAAGRRKATHHFYPNRTFEYKDSGGEDKECDACGGDFKGCFYKGYSHGLRHREQRDLHVSCMLLKPVLRLNEFIRDDDDELRDAVLVLKKEIPSAAKCVFCSDRKANGKRTWAYMSTKDNFHCHVSCLRAFATEKLEDDRHNGTTGHEQVAGWMETFLGSAAPDTLHLTVHGRGAAARRRCISRVKKIMQVLLAVIVGAIVGDPVTMLVGAITTAVS